MQVWVLDRLKPDTPVEVYVSREAAIAGTGAAWVPMPGGQFDGEWIARDGDTGLMSLYPVEVLGESVRSAK